MPDQNSNQMPRRPRLKHTLEAAAVGGMVKLFSALSLDKASALGGFLGRSLGPMLGVSRRAERRLASFFPDKSAAQIRAIIVAMWDNLGRTVAEFPHLSDLDTINDNDRIEVTGAENITDLIASGTACIYFSAHFGNWELVPLALDQRKVPLTIAYREANNPLVDQIIKDLRSQAVQSAHVPKGSAGAKALLLALKKGGSLGLLVDQKMNDGIAVPLFGRDAMTAPALAQLALKYNTPIIPIHCIRTEGAHFRMVIEKPLQIASSAERKTDIYNIMCEVNDHIEVWVRAHPGQWMWVHNRWPKNKE